MNAVKTNTTIALETLRQIDEYKYVNEVYELPGEQDNSSHVFAFANPQIPDGSWEFYTKPLIENDEVVAYEVVEIVRFY